MLIKLLFMVMQWQLGFFWHNSSGFVILLKLLQQLPRTQW